MDKSSCHDGQVSRRNLAPRWSLEGRSASDVHRGVPVGVAQVATRAAPKDGTPSDSTAGTSGALLAHASRMDQNDKPLVLAGHRLERRSESAVWQPFGLAVPLPSTTTSMIQVLQVLDGDERVVAPGQVHDFVRHLLAPSLREIPFFPSQSPQSLSGISAPFCSVREELGTSQGDVSLSVADVLAEVQLLQDVAALADNRHRSKPLYPDVNAKDRVVIPPEEFGLVVMLRGNEELPCAEPERGSPPAVFQRLREPPVCPVHSNRYGDPFLQGPDRDDGVASSGRRDGSRARYIVRDGDATDRTTVLQYWGRVPEQGAGDHAGDPESPDVVVERLLKGNLLVFPPLLYHEGEGLFVSHEQFVEHLLLASARTKKIQYERLLDDPVQSQRPENRSCDSHKSPPATRSSHHQSM